MAFVDHSFERAPALRSQVVRALAQRTHQQRLERLLLGQSTGMVWGVASELACKWMRWIELTKYEARSDMDGDGCALI